MSSIGRGYEATPARTCLSEKYWAPPYGRVIATELNRPDHPLTEPTGADRPDLGLHRVSPGKMELQGDSTNRPVAASLKATYRALLARGLEAGEAANLTAFLHGLPSAGVRWTLPEVEAILRRRLEHAAELRAATTSRTPAAAHRGRSTIHDRRPTRSGSTHVIDPPKP